MQIQLSSDQKAWAPKLKILKNPFQFLKGYLVHFETNLIDFCDFGCVRSKTTKYRDNGAMSKDLWIFIHHFALITFYVATKM
jgi:hypothetical protein